LFWMGANELLAEGDQAGVVRQSFIDLAQVSVLLAEVLERSAEKELVLVVIRGQRDSFLFLGEGFLERRDRLSILPQFVAEITQGIPATSKGSAVACLIGMGLDELVEDFDGPLKRGKRFVVLMGPVL